MADCEHEAEIATIIEQQRQTDKDRESIHNKLDKILLILNGNGKDGLFTKVSKHDEWIANRKKIEWAFIIVAIGLIVKDFWPN